MLNYLNIKGISDPIDNLCVVRLYPLIYYIPGPYMQFMYSIFTYLFTQKEFSPIYIPSPPIYSPGGRPFFTDAMPFSFQILDFTRPVKLPWRPKQKGSDITDIHVSNIYLMCMIILRYRHDLVQISITFHNIK